MNLVNELGSEMALAILVEKRHAKKLNSREVLTLIDKIEEALQPFSSDENFIKSISSVKQNRKTFLQ